MLPIKKATTVLMLGMSLLLHYGTVSAFTMLDKNLAAMNRRILVKSAKQLEEGEKMIDRPLFQRVTVHNLANMVEEQCISLIPNILLEYTDKIEEGEKMKDRPDLILELNSLLASQLEIECTAVMPSVWSEYVNKLEEGEELKDRQDCIFELFKYLELYKATVLIQLFCPGYIESFEEVPDMHSKLTYLPLANQVEIESIALIPDIWLEYVNKLKEGEEIKDRLDLIIQLAFLLLNCKGDITEQMKLTPWLAPDSVLTFYRKSQISENWQRDHKEAIAMLNTENIQRAGRALKENTNFCPEATWATFEEKAGNGNLIESPELLVELGQELGYQNLIGAGMAFFQKDSGIAAKVTGENIYRYDATTVSDYL